MNERITVVVNSFRTLTDIEKVAAYIEIEEIWKALQAKPVKLRAAGRKFSGIPAER